jgi:hypothetical protein
MASSMDAWIPVLILPNLDMQGAVECEFAAIVSPVDARVEQIRREHPNLTMFLGKFSGQFKEQCWPSLLILRADAPDTCRTAEAVTGFRDLVSLCTIPLARAKRLRFDRAQPFVYSTAFQFYPWMLDAHYEDLIMTSPASLGTHLLSAFRGQSFPEQSQVSLMERDIDIPLAEALLERWVTRFPQASTKWSDRALFRSLNTANEAARIPALAASTFYDVGRTLALWVSAFEILAHPGAGQSNFTTVAEIIEKVNWLDPALAAAAHNVAIGKKAPALSPLATWVYKKIYDLRNDYLHGNEVAAASLMLNGKAIIDFAACVYRLALVGFLSLEFSKPQARATQGSFEAAIRTAI